MHQKGVILKYFVSLTFQIVSSNLTIYFKSVLDNENNDSMKITMYYVINVTIIVLYKKNNIYYIIVFKHNQT